MSKLMWDEVGKKLFETGIDRGVLFKQDAGGTYPKGVAWNGLTAVTESPSGAEATAIYADNVKYLSLMSAEEFGGTIEAYTYPDEFEECNGGKSLVEGVEIGQQPRKPFGFCYRTLIGNDVSGDDYGYKIHLVYGCLAAPSEKGYQTKSDSPEAITLSWEITTTPVAVENNKPTATLVIDSTKIEAAALTKIEAVLYGGESTESRLPLPDEILTIIAAG